MLLPLLYTQRLVYIRIADRWSVIPCWTKCCGALQLFSVLEKQVGFFCSTVFTEAIEHSVFTLFLVTSYKSL